MTKTEVEQNIPEAVVSESNHSFVIKLKNITLQLHKEHDAKSWKSKVAYAKHLQSLKS